MAATNDGPVSTPLTRLFSLISLERKEIYSIYFYAILSGLIALSLPLGIQAIINFLFGGRLSTSLVILIAVVVAGVFFNGMLQVMQMRINERIQRRIFTRYTLEFAHVLPRLRLEAIDDYYLPELVNRFFDTAALQKGISKLLLDFPSAMVQIIFGLLLLSLYSPFFIFFGLFLVLLIAIMFRITGPKGLQTSLEESNYKYDTASWLEEVARTLKMFKFMGVNEYPLKRADGLVSNYLDAREKHFDVLVIQYYWFIAFKVAITAALLILGSILFVDQQINIGQFIASEIVILTILSSVEKFITSLETVYDTLTSIEKIGKVLDKPTETFSGITLQQAADQKGVAIKLEDFSFRYPDDQRNTLQQLSFSIAAGEKICIAGPEGAGKTTLLRMFTGAYPDFKGQLLLNEIPIKNYNLETLRQNIGVALSTVDIFTGTLLENLTLGDENISIQQVMKVSDEMGLTAFIQSQEHGLNTQVDAMGRKLPRNVMNKICLTRALLNKPKLLLIEDAWQGLDQGEQRKIINYFTHRSAPFTMLAVSNDPDFARRCDKILILAENGIEAYGSYEELQHKSSFKKSFLKN